MSCADAALCPAAWAAQDQLPIGVGQQVGKVRRAAGELPDPRRFVAEAVDADRQPLVHRGGVEDVLGADVDRAVGAVDAHANFRRIQTGTTRMARLSGTHGHAGTYAREPSASIAFTSARAPVSALASNGFRPIRSFISDSM